MPCHQKKKGGGGQWTGTQPCFVFADQNRASCRLAIAEKVVQLLHRGT